jgi:hypothetical protein
MFPLGSLFDTDDIAHPPSPTAPFTFPFDPSSDHALDGMLAEIPAVPTTMDSVTHIVGIPRFCGLCGVTSIPTDQGGELAGSSTLSDMILHNHGYVFEPTGAGSPSQNGAAEIYNDKLAVQTCTLLYSAWLPARFWSSALLHAVYLHNHLIHSSTKHTPFEGYFGTKSDLAGLKMFGSRVCVKHTGHQRSKLDRHDFDGIFIGYSASHTLI